jgi:hypothetical protein
MEEIKQESDGNVQVGYKPDVAKKPAGWIKITLEGEVWVTKDSVGNNIEHPTEEKPFAGVPRKFRDRHAEAMLKIHQAVLFIKHKMPNRILPLLRKELIKEVQIPKQVLADLVEMGLLREHFIDVNNSGRHVGKRILMCFSPQGNAYAREKIIKPRMDGHNV